MRPRSIVTSLALSLLFLQAAFAQNAAPALKAYDAEGLKFDYPADWTLVDKSTPEVQHLLLTKPDSMLLIVIVSPREFLTERRQFALLHSSVYRNYFSAMEDTLKTKNKDPEREYFCTDVKGHSVGSTRIKGLYKDDASTGEIYSFGFFRRYLGLVYFKSDKEAAAGDPVMNDLIKSINLYPENGLPDLTLAKDYIEGGVLNGIALYLPKPFYPSEAKGATGMIKVKVKINEKGDVVEAATSDGNGHLRTVAEWAARRAKFSPTTICNGGIKVRGVITYNFVR